MPSINTGSDLLEVVFSPEEAIRAKALCDTNLSVQYLQNTRVAHVRALAAQTIMGSPEERERANLERAAMHGKIELLQALIDGALGTLQPSQPSSS